MTPNTEDRAAIAREVLAKPEHHARIDKAMASLAKAWPVLAKHAPHIDGEFDLALTDVKRLVELVRDVCPAALTPPPIPLDTVVEVEGDPDAPYRRVAGAWSDRSGNRWSDADAATIAAPLTALHHARRETEELRAIAGAMRATLAMVRKQRDDAERERGEMEQTIRQLNEMVDTTHAQRDEARADVNRWINAAMAALMPDEFGLEFDPTNPEGWAMTRRAVFERVLNERDAARRELAAVKDQGLGASAPNSEGQGPMIPTDGPPSPVPASAPCAHTHTSPNADTPHADVVSETAPLPGAGNTGEMGKPRRWWLVVDHNGTAKSVETSEAYAEWFAQYYGLANNIRYTVVPVIEARVTREMVERVVALMKARTGTVMPYADVARLVVREIGLTVEE